MRQATILYAYAGNLTEMGMEAQHVLVSVKLTNILIQNRIFETVLPVNGEVF